MKGSLLCIGAGPGLGYRTALRFAREGYRPILAARSLERLGRMAGEIERETGVGCAVEKTDAANARELAALADKYGKETEILFYNAAILRPQSLPDATDESLERDMAVDLTGALVSVRNILPHMTANGRGTILLTGGGFALAPLPGYLALSVGKAGIRCLCQALFDELKKINIHIATVMIKKAMKEEDGDQRKVAEMFWKIFSQPKDVWSLEEIYE